VDVRIGVTQSVREIEIELDDEARDQVRADVAAAIAGESMLWLTDKKGRTVGVPAAKIGYIELGGPSEDRKVGFGR
jgi:Protein of unknown function (DUF3107)